VTVTDCPLVMWYGLVGWITQTFRLHRDFGKSLQRNWAWLKVKLTFLGGDLKFFFTDFGLQFRHRIL